jgi:hypothetical protein
LDVKIIQTADPFNYRRMLEATSKTALAYCERHDFTYESYVGIKRGFYGCHATFNRMFMLTELLDRGYGGWVLYMDADAYIYDLGFDLRGYLEQHRDRSAIMATIDGETTPWHINAGVLMFNLGHPHCAPLIHDWKRRFLILSEETLRSVTSVWGDENDQAMLCSTLYEHEEWRSSVFYEHAININHVDGMFIRQYLGAFDKNIETRTQTVESLVAQVLVGSPGAERQSEEWATLIESLYRGALHRDPDDGGMQNYLADMRVLGTALGVETVLRSLLSSEEARTRYAGD